METNLNKQQLHAALRELGVAFPAEANRAELQEILDLENHRRWLKRAHLQSEQGLRIIRKKHNRRSLTIDKPQKGPKAAIETKSSSVSRRGPELKDKPKDNVRPVPPAPETDETQTEKPEYTHTSVKRTKDAKASALRRAGGICELCERPAAGNKDFGPVNLEPCFFGDLQSEEAATNKNVAALCPDCATRLLSERLPADIKKLKRQTRRQPIVKISVKTRPSTKAPNMK